MRVGGEPCFSIPFSIFFFFAFWHFSYIVPGGGHRGGASLPYCKHTSMVQPEVVNHFQQVGNSYFLRKSVFSYICIWGGEPLPAGTCQQCLVFAQKARMFFSRTRPTKVFLLPSHLYQLLFRPSSFLSYEGDPGTTHQGWREGGERIAADLEGGGKFTAGLEETEVSPCLEEGGQGVAAFLEETWYLGGWAPHVQSLQCPAWPQRSWTPARDGAAWLLLCRC